MAELIALIILAFGICGMSVILLRKIPVLVALPKTTKKPGENFLPLLKNKIGNSSFVKSLSVEIFLQKILSKIRILTLKAESKIAFWLQRLRERSLQRTKNFHDGYWIKLKGVKKSESKMVAKETKSPLSK